MNDARHSYAMKTISKSDIFGCFDQVLGDMLYWIHVHSTNVCPFAVYSSQVPR